MARMLGLNPFDDGKQNRDQNTATRTDSRNRPAEDPSVNPLTSGDGTLPPSQHGLGL